MENITRSPIESDTDLASLSPVTMSEKTSPATFEPPSDSLSDERITPMLKQYQDIKAKHPNCILFFRLGDFYEMFFEDAKIGSRVLDLVLTSRGKTPVNKIPMCGIPYHAADNYIAKFVKAGYKIAICEQMEDPALAKGLVKRDVIRIITTGTYLDEHNSNAHYVVCLLPGAKSVGVAFVDPVSGTIQTNQYPLADPENFISPHVAQLIARLSVFECIFPQSMESAVKKFFDQPLLKLKNITLSAFEDWSFNKDICRKSLLEHFSVANLHGFGIEELPEATGACGALLEYLKRMNKQPLRHIDRVARYSDEEFMFISPAAHRGLELNTLIETLDHTVTALGKRKFRFWFYHPLNTRCAIESRQQAVSVLKERPNIQRELNGLLSRIPDIEKNISRLSCGLTHPRDLLAIRNSLSLVPEIQLTVNTLAETSPLLAVRDIPDLRKFLETTVNEDIPLSHPEGKVIKKGYHQGLDELRDIQANGRQWLKELQLKEIKRSGINSLKIGFNNVFGYYIEITKSHLNNVPSDYIRKQTLVNAERFITPQLKEFEEKILSAEEKILKIENELIGTIRQRILDASLSLHALCEQIASLDSIYSLSLLAQNANYVMPQITEDSIIDIKGGRHPVVEKTLQRQFVANDTFLNCDDSHMMILTGPNMAGKSTYIRQTAILAIMGQVGSFIPADSAAIGLIDKIFTRIGAHDDISRGQSTFMVEMNETADILNNLTDRSLVILDEIGRGTSTYDGLSLAWALAEHLAHTKSRTLFATHFHELTVLADEHTGVKNYNVAVKEWKDEIIFLHKIVPGSTDDSYGIYVAKLAGIPAAVINRARKILTQLELKNDLKDGLKKGVSTEVQPTFFEKTDPLGQKLISAVESMDINEMKPLEALNKLQELKDLIKEKE